ncbi:MAG: hypothetical protein ACE5NM_04505 [Sedimentisphaerales bacterium]
MTISRGIILALTVATMVAVSSLPCWAAQKEEQDIWRQDEPRGPRLGPGPRRRMFELTDEEIDRIMKGLKEKAPEKAKELAKLREEDPAKFQAELRRHGREEFGKIIRERIDTWRRKRRAEFVEWLRKNYRRQAEKLAKLKETNADLYWKEFDRLREKYWRIFEEERRNPELADVLKEDLELKERRDELLRRIKAAQGDKDKQKLLTELEQVVGRRFDLIVRRKEIAYERLLRWLEELRTRVRESRDEIAKWKDEKFKAENINKHVKDLLEQTPQFRWD